MNASTAAALERAEAEAQAFLAAVHADPDIESSDSGPGGQAVEQRLVDRMDGGSVSLCAHLSPETPVLSFWLADLPDQVRCRPCTTRGSRESQNRPAAKRCDSCYRKAPDFHSTVHHVGSRTDALGRLWPPIIVSYGLCADCDRFESAAQP